MPIAPFKHNFFPRPRCQMHACLLRTVVELTGEAVITAMAVWNNRLYFATQNPLYAVAGNRPPRIYVYDPALGTTTAVALPGAFVSNTNTSITGMVVYNDQLWIVSGASATAADNGQIFALSTVGVWTAAAALGFPGWTGGTVANMLPTMFLFGTQIIIAGTGGAGTLRFHFYNGLAWVEENTAFAATVVTTRDQVVTVNGTLYFGIQGGGNASIQFRTPAAVYGQQYTYPINNPPMALAAMNNQLWAGQFIGAGGLAGTLLRALPMTVPADMLLRVTTGVTYLTPISSGTPLTATDGQVMLMAALGGLFLLERDGSLRVLVLQDNDVFMPFIKTVNRVHYVAQCSLPTAGPATLASPQVTSRISLLE